jgi:hypothetical protein
VVYRGGGGTVVSLGFSNDLCCIMCTARWCIRARDAGQRGVL